MTVEAAKSESVVAPAASLETGEARGSDTVTVITVHGTFAQGAKWIEAISPVMQAVIERFAREGIACRVCPLRWSGANTVAGRHSAAQDLLELIERESRTNDPLIVLAHSHGGAVVSHACKEAPYLGGRVQGVVAVATPWISARADAHAAALRLMLARIASFFLLCGALSVLPGILSWFILRATQHKQVTASLVISELVVNAIWASLIGFALAWLFFAVHVAAVRHVRNTMPRFLSDLARYAEGVSSARGALPPTTALLAPGDEALGLLRIMRAVSAPGRNVATATARLAEYVEAIPRWIRGAGLLVFMLLVGVLLPNIVVRFVLAVLGLDVAIDAITYAFLALGVIGLVCFVSSGSFGAFGSLPLMYCRFNVRNAPEGAHELHYVHLPRPEGLPPLKRRALTHSALYGSALGIARIAEALLLFHPRFHGSRAAPGAGTPLPAHHS